MLLSGMPMSNPSLEITLTEPRHVLLCCLVLWCRCSRPEDTLTMTTVSLYCSCLGQSSGFSGPPQHPGAALHITTALASGHAPGLFPKQQHARKGTSSAVTESIAGQAAPGGGRWHCLRPGGCAVHSQGLGSHGTGTSNALTSSVCTIRTGASSTSASSTACCHVCQCSS